MTLNSCCLLLAFATPQTPPGTEADPRGQMIQMVGMIVLMGIVFYFALIRPQRLRARQLDTLVKTLKPGDKVVTTSGIIGVVVNVKDKSLSLRSAETKLEILKSTVAEITERAGESKP